MSSLPTSASRSTLSCREFSQAPVQSHGFQAAATASGQDGRSTLNPLAKEFVPYFSGEVGSSSSSGAKNPSGVANIQHSKGRHADPSRNGGVTGSGVEAINRQPYSEEHVAAGGLSAAVKGLQGVDQEKGTLKMGHSADSASHVSTSSSSGRRGQSWNANHLLNFQYDPIVRPPPRIPPQRRQQRSQPYDKELFLQANFRFLVSDLGDYMENSSDPDKMLQWEDIALVELSASAPVQCPICLESPPLCPQITSCGHIFCFPCILRYFMIGEDEHRTDHWKKCPLCFTMTSCKELRTLYIYNVKHYNVGADIDFTLLTRPKGSVIPLQNNESWGSMTYSKDGRCHLYSKFTLTSDIEQTTNNAVAELTAWAEIAQFGGTEELQQLPHVFAAIDQLKMRKVAWDEHRTLEFVSSSPPVRQRIMAQAKAGITKLPSVAGQDNDVNSTGSHSQRKQPPEVVESQAANPTPKKGTVYRVNAFTDEQERIDAAPKQLKEFHQSFDEKDIPDAWEALVNAPENLHVKHDNLEKDASPKKPEETDSYSFYQAADGQLIILHPVNMKCLVHHYGSYRELPSILQARICEMETITQTEATRRRYRYLSHLPLTSIFQLCEVDLSKHLPSSALSPYAEELQARESRRQRRLEQEKQLKAAEEKREASAKPPSPADFVAIMNVLHDEEVPRSVDFADSLVSAPVVTNPPPVDDRKLFSSVTKLGYAAGYDAPELANPSANGPSNRPNKPSPTTAETGAGRGSTLSFADVIQKEKEKPQDASPAAVQGSKKGKKPSRILLSTSGGRKY